MNKSAQTPRKASPKKSTNKQANNQLTKPTNTANDTAANAAKSGVIVPITPVNRVDPIELDQFDSKATELENTLATLATELEETNDSAQLSLGLIDDQEADITLKVASIYKELGQLDSHYRSITARLKDTHDEIQSASDRVFELANQDKPDSRSHKLAKRATSLTHKVEHTASLLKQSINENSLALKTLGNLTMTELEIENINDNLSDTNKKIQTQKAHILSLQSVDKALASRAATLEKTTDSLRDQTDLLSNTINDLGIRTEALISTSRSHKGLILGLQSITNDLGEQLMDAKVDLGNKLVVLGERESKHFKTLSGAMLLMLIGIVGYSIYDNNRLGATNQAAISNSQSISSNGQNIVSNETAVTELDAELSAQLAVVNTKINTISEQVDSVRGQMAASDPFSQFGSDSILHGPEWLAGLPDTHYIIDLGLFESKKAIFEAAVRYGSYFDKQLAYFPVQTAQGEQLVMVYASFASPEQAQQIARRLPRISNAEAIVQTVNAVKQAL